MGTQTGRKTQAFLVTIGVMVAVLGSGRGFGATLSGIEFKADKDRSIIEVMSDGPVTFDKQLNASDNQVVIEVKGATLGPRAQQKLDTSSFPGKVSLVSPYNVDGQADTARIVVQLREPGDAIVTQEGNVLKIAVINGDVASSGSAPLPPGVAKAPDPVPTPGGEAGDATLGTNTVAGAPSATTLDTASAATSTASGAPSALDEFMKNRETRKFTGTPMSIQLREADVIEVLRLIGEISGFNILVGDDVRGALTLSLNNVPWDQALDVILRTLHLGAERNNNLLRIVTLANLTAEKQAELQAKQVAEASAPRVTRVFPIKYADPAQLQTILSTFGSPRTPQVGGAPTSQPGIVMVDQRTNNIVVQDLPDNIERMRKLIELLDTQTPQVMIEAKVIEASELFAKTLSGSLGMGGNTMASPFAASFAGANPIDALYGTPGVFADGAAVASGSSDASSTFGFSPWGLVSTFGILPGLQRINAVLSIGEQDEQVRIVSSPRTVVLNKRTATIIQGTPVLVPQTQTIPGVGTVQITTPQTANLSLTVTPTVTNDGSVLMTLNVQRDVAQTNTVAQRSMNTEVLVDSGSTLVIGGVYTMETRSQDKGFPFLRKIPIIGTFFGSESESTKRSELFIFITPRILNEREAGLSG